MSNLAESTETFSARKNIFIARQPIFDAELNVQAYELLFRDEDVSVANISDGNIASSQVMINAFLEIGIDTITDKRLSFINLTRDFIVGRLPLPATRYPLPATRYPLPATRYPLPATRDAKRSRH